MVKSILDSSINYPEIRKLNDDDKNHEAAIYEATIFGKNAIIAIGQENKAFMDKNIIYFPVYLVKNDKVTTQIGVYEIMESNQSSILDDDGDIDVDKLGSLLIYSFVNSNFILLNSDSVNVETEDDSEQDDSEQDDSEQDDSEQDDAEQNDAEQDEA